MTERWYEDFKIGDEIFSEPYFIDADDIIGFANKYDPQYFHTSEADAKTGPFEGLIASGWHICALAFRLFMDTNPYGKASLGAPGVDGIQWRRPIRPNDEINVRVSVVNKRLSKSQSDRGIVHLDWTVTNQNGESVLTMQGPIMLLCRPAS
jgi:acyl dehydratase